MLEEIIARGVIAIAKKLGARLTEEDERRIIQTAKLGKDLSPMLYDLNKPKGKDEGEEGDKK